MSTVDDIVQQNKEQILKARTKGQKFVRQVLVEGGMYMGEPDGPMRFVKSLDMEVPTYIDPREDLKSNYNCANAHKAVDYHIPPPMRGTYFPIDLPDYDVHTNYPITRKMHVRCGGLKADGQICQKSAMNRTGFCSNHGGALHPADKIYTVKRGVAPTRQENLTRLEKVLLEIIPISELTDDEISKQSVRDDNGLWVALDKKLTPKLQAEMHREFYTRADRYIREQTLTLLETMKNIALSDANEAADRQKAAQWLIERSLGKTPDILLTNKTDKPFEQLMGDVMSGSREDYRQGKHVAIGDANTIEGEVVVIDEEGEEIDEESDSEEDGQTVEPLADVHTSTESVLVPVFEARESNVEEQYADVIDIQNRQAEIAKEKRAAKERILKARKRRYAARSQGLDSISNLAYGIELKTETNSDGSKQTRMKLIAPDAVKLPRTR